MTVGELRNRLADFEDETEVKMKNGAAIGALTLHDDGSLRVCPAPSAARDLLEGFGPRYSNPEKGAVRR